MNTAARLGPIDPLGSLSATWHGGTVAGMKAPLPWRLTYEVPLELIGALICMVSCCG